LPEPQRCGFIFARDAMVISLRATSDLARMIPPTGKVEIEEEALVEDVLEGPGIDSGLVILVVVDGKLADVDSPLKHGATLELIPPISGG
jgi:molybdopterin converting factor small subunit